MIMMMMMMMMKKKKEEKRRKRKMKKIMIMKKQMKTAKKNDKIRRYCVWPFVCIMTSFDSKNTAHRCHRLEFNPYFRLQDKKHIFD